MFLLLVFFFLLFLLCGKFLLDKSDLRCRFSVLRSDHYRDQSDQPIISDRLVAANELLESQRAAYRAALQFWKSVSARS